MPSAEIESRNIEDLEALRMVALSQTFGWMAQMRFYRVNTVYRRLATVHAVSYFHWHSQGTGSGKADGIHPSLPIVSDSLYIHQWPSTHSISMVWQSLVSLSEDLQSLPLHSPADPIRRTVE